MKETKKIKLYCIPYAGGSAAIYYRWRPYFQDNIEIVPLELKGRGQRVGEAFYESLEEAVEDLFDIIKDELDNSPYMIFGHSMGSMLAFQLVHKIQENRYPMPMRLFVSGRKSPIYSSIGENMHDASIEKIKAKMLSYGGTPPEVFEDPKLIEYFLPVIRADYYMMEKFVYKDFEEKLDCKIAVFYGLDDKDTDEETVKEWSKYTMSNINVYAFEGNHFFIESNKNKVCETINQIVASDLALTD